MKIRTKPSAQKAGSAVIIILILLFAMVAFSVSNIAALNRLKKEIDIVEKGHRGPTNPIVSPTSK